MKTSVFGPAKLATETIAVLGLGYVGLPLAVNLAEKFDSVIGYDISEHRVARLVSGIDDTSEMESDRLTASGIQATTDPSKLAHVSFYIVTVPTPITQAKQPDLEPLRLICETMGKYLSPGNIVVFESTVYPGVTEEFCGPILERISGLVAGVGFHLAYSPERINPGDKVNTVENVVKNIAADDPRALDRVAHVYGTIVTAGLFRCPSIKVAEGAKVLENTQRDVNIALMNELAMICDKIGIQTLDVIEAASSKWNFVPFVPGLVGGHCIGVDPYYLASLGHQVGLHPDVILAGRRVNDDMAEKIATWLVQKLAQKICVLRHARVGVLGVTFKENVPDVRNSKALDLVKALRLFGIDVLVHDSQLTHETEEKQTLALSSLDQMHDLDMLILAVPHRDYLAGETIFDLMAPNAIFADIKGVFRHSKLPHGTDYWAL